MEVFFLPVPDQTQSLRLAGDGRLCPRVTWVDRAV